MKSVINGKRRGIRWTFTSLLEDLDFADDIALLSHRHQDMQAKIKYMTRKAGEIGLKISTKKTKHLRMNSRTEAAIMPNGEEIEAMEDFTYLGSKMTTSRDTEKEIRTRISKASQAFATLRSTWRSRNVSTKTKIGLFKSNVLSTLLYGAESWKMTKTISHKLEVFQNRCLCRILNIFWPNTISTAELHRTTTKLITQEVQMRRWRWIGHVLRMAPTTLPRVALRWTPDGHSKRGRPKETWSSVEREREMREQGWTWGYRERCATD